MVTPQERFLIEMAVGRKLAEIVRDVLLNNACRPEETQRQYTERIMLLVMQRLASDATAKPQHSQRQSHQKTQD